MNKIKLHLGLQKLPETPDCKWGWWMPRKETFSTQKRNSTLHQPPPEHRTDTLTWPLAVNTWLIRFSSLTLCVCTVTNNIKALTLHVSPTKKETSEIQRRIWEKRLFSYSPRRHFSLQSSRVSQKECKNSKDIS